MTDAEGIKEDATKLQEALFWIYRERVIGPINVRPPGNGAVQQHQRPLGLGSHAARRAANRSAGW
jgi:hypothetical protein